MDIAGILLARMLFGVVFALIVGLLAKRKRRNVFLWVVAGAMAGLLTLVGLAFFHSLDKLSEDERKRSQTREKIFCGCMIVVGTISALAQLFG